MPDSGDQSRREQVSCQRGEDFHDRDLLMGIQLVRLDSTAARSLRSLGRGKDAARGAAQRPRSELAVVLTGGVLHGVAELRSASTGDPQDLDGIESVPWTHCGEGAK